MELRTTARMRQAAPDLCWQIEDLRKERRAVVDRHYYLKNLGKEEEASVVLRGTESIDAKIAHLHAAAKRRLMTGVATDVMQEAHVLQAAASDAKTINDTLAIENERHHEAVSKIVARQNELGGTMIGACNALEVAAANLIDATMS